MKRCNAFLAAGGVLIAAAAFNAAWSANPAPTGDSYYYYEIGGAKATLGALNPNVNPRPLTASASFSLGYSCGKFDPLLSVNNFLDRARQGADDMANQAVSAANAAIAALPMLILSRANPDLMKIFEETLARAEASVSLATKSCKQMEDEIRGGQSPYEDWVTLSATRDWKDQMALGGDVVQASQTIEAKLGTNGVPWIGGADAGGEGQPPVRPLSDIARAGYNIMANRAVTDTSPLPAGTLPNMRRYWETPDAFQEWVEKVVGGQGIQIFSGGQKQSRAGVGLAPEIDSYTGSLMAQLSQMVNGTLPLTLTQLESVSPPGTTITRQVIEAIQAMPRDEQAITISKLADETAVQTVTTKALAARRLLITGLHEPNVVGAGKSIHADLERQVNDLEHAINDALFEARTRKELVSATVMTILRKDDARKRAAVGAPSLSPSDPHVLDKGAVR